MTRGGGSAGSTPPASRGRQGAEGRQDTHDAEIGVPHLYVPKGSSPGLSVSIRTGAPAARTPPSRRPDPALGGESPLVGVTQRSFGIPRRWLLETVQFRTVTGVKLPHPSLQPLARRPNSIRTSDFTPRLSFHETPFYFKVMESIDPNYIR